jgi:hypothetical protein
VRLVAGAAGHPENAQNFYRIIGIDPAMSGDTAAVAYAVDRRTHKRYVMDVHVMSSPTPAAIRSLIRSGRMRTNRIPSLLSQTLFSFS